jgi:uncharacterized spore protein YtfJ
MEPSDVIAQAKDTLTVQRVFGDPYERNGITVIPAASVRGGGGGGKGEGARGEGADGGTGTGTGSGSGGGFGMTAKPAGVYVIKGNDVRWQPAVDLNRIILGGQVVAIVAFLVLRSIFRRR